MVSRLHLSCMMSYEKLIMSEFNKVQGATNDKCDEELIIQKFMAELCIRDDEDNRTTRPITDRVPNVFSVEGIRQKVLAAFDIETVRRALRGHRLKNRDNEPLEFLDNEDNVRLTNAGSARCDEYGI